MLTWFCYCYISKVRITPSIFYGIGSKVNQVVCTLIQSCSQSGYRGCEPFSGKIICILQTQHVVWWCFIFLKIFMSISWMTFNLYSGDKTTIVKLQRRITPKINRQELHCLWSVHDLMMFYISVKFYKNILKGFLLTQRQRNYHCQTSKENNSKMYKQELRFLFSARNVMMFYISVKFHENT